MPQKHYQARSDVEKLHAQWRKLSGLHTREEWSAAVVRAATASEIAANIAIRSEYKARSKLSPQFVDSTLKWANGLAGKLDRLLEPLWTDQPKKLKKLKGLKKSAKEINERRNAVVHAGEFCNKDEAKKVIDAAYQFIVELVGIYDDEFSLKNPSQV